MKRFLDRVRAAWAVVHRRLRRIDARLLRFFVTEYKAGWTDFWIFLVQCLNLAAVVLLGGLSVAAITQFPVTDVAILAEALTWFVLSSGIAWRLRQILRLAHELEHEKTLILVASQVRQFTALWVLAFGLSMHRYLPDAVTAIPEQARKLLIGLATIGGIKMAITAGRDYRHGRALAADEARQEAMLNTLVKAITYSTERRQHGHSSGHSGMD